MGSTGVRPTVLRVAITIATALSACTSVPEPRVVAPEEPAAVSEDPTTAAFRLFAESGLPQVQGLQRIEQDLGVGSNAQRRCRQAWVISTGEFRVLLFDDLRFDYDGQFLARWSTTMRVPAGSYQHAPDGAKRPNSRAARTSLPATAEPETVLGERPVDLVAEALSSRGRADRCHDPTSQEALARFARVAWLDALGHPELARQLAVEVHGLPSLIHLRTQLREALTEIADDGLAQGMPRLLAREWLQRARRIDPSFDPHGRERSLVGNDPASTLQPNDPESLVAWLGEELTFPNRGFENGRAGWSDGSEPRSPAFDLIALGWSALPALVELAGPELRLRLPRRLREVRRLATTGDLALEVAERIARRAFASRSQLQAWWSRVGSLDEFDALAADFHEASFARPRVSRMAALDADKTLALAVALWASLEDSARLAILTAVTQVFAPEPVATAASHSRADALHSDDERERLVELFDLAAKDPALEVAVAGFEGHRRLSPTHAWVRRAMRRAIAALADPTAGDASLCALLVTIARADPNRGAHLLGLGSGARRSGARQTTERALYEICDRDPVSTALARLCRAADRAETRREAAL